MSGTYLDAILDFHRERAARDERVWSSRHPTRAPGPSLIEALRAHRPHGLAVIAEVKRRSPSRGWLAEGADAVAVATAYVAGGASAVSVLTDEPHFGGSLADLAAVSAAVAVPTLRKDFIVAANDVVDAVDAGASAVLLIVAALTDDELRDLLAVAATVGVEALVEVHTVSEARRALAAGATAIGVNQRDLQTFTVDPTRAEAVVATLPRDVIGVAESGFTDTVATARAAAAGFDAVLIGESLVTAHSPRDEVSRYVGAPIGGRS